MLRMFIIILEVGAIFSHAPCFWILTFFRTFQLPPTFRMSCFWNISVFSGISNYPRIFKCPVFLNINVFSGISNYPPDFFKCPVFWNVGLNIILNVDLHMTTNVGFNTTPNFARTGKKSKTLLFAFLESEFRTPKFAKNDRESKSMFDQLNQEQNNQEKQILTSKAAPNSQKCAKMDLELSKQSGTNRKKKYAWA